MPTAWTRSPGSFAPSTAGKSGHDRLGPPQSAARRERNRCTRCGQPPRTSPSRPATSPARHDSSSRPLRTLASSAPPLLAGCWRPSTCGRRCSPSSVRTGTSACPNCGRRPRAASPPPGGDRRRRRLRTRPLTLARFQSSPRILSSRYTGWLARRRLGRDHSSASNRADGLAPAARSVVCTRGHRRGCSKSCATPPEGTATRFRKCGKTC
jgi:hypothetical protein